MKVMEKRLWRRASLSIEARLRNMERGSFIREFERWMKEALEVGCLSLSLSEGALWGNLEGGILYCETWRICGKGSGDGHLSP